MGAVTSLIKGPPKPPKAPPLPPLLPQSPDATDPGVLAAREQQRLKAAIAGGRAATVATSAQGLTTPSSTTKKTLLGS